MTDVVVSKLQLRRSFTPGYRPASLAEGEVFVQFADQKWIVGGLNGASQVDVPFSSVGGGGSYTLPAATADALGGIKTGTPGSGKFVSGFGTDGTAQYGTPAGGTGGSYTLPAASALALGGVKSAAAPSNQFQTGIDTTGAPTFAQPTILNVSGLQAALDAKAPLASPAFTGTATAVGLTAGSINVTGAGGLSVTQNATVGGSLTITGALSAGTFSPSSLTTSGTVNAAGVTAGSANITGAGGLSVTNNALVGGSLTVSGSFSAGSMSFSSLSVSGTGTFNGVTAGSANLNGSGGLSVAQNAAVGGSLTVSGASTLTGTVTTTNGINVGGGMNVSGGSLIAGLYMHDGTVDFQSGSNWSSGVAKTPSSNYVRMYGGGSSGWVQFCY